MGSGELGWEGRGWADGVGQVCVGWGGRGGVGWGRGAWDGVE